jgi:hypothetical protein
MSAPSDSGPSAPLDEPVRLPEAHLALIIEDLLAAAGGAVSSTPDLDAVLLYGWASGASSGAEIARRVPHDPGLQHLLWGSQPRAEELSAFRDGEAARLEDRYAQAFGLARKAGLATLGGIALEPRTAPGGPVDPNGGWDRWLAGHLLASSVAADQREGPAGAAVPSWASTRAGRRASFRESVAVPVRSPQPPSVSAAGLLGRLAAVLVLLMTGLVAVRWVSAASAPAADRTPSVPSVPSGLPFDPVPQESAVAALPSDTPDTSDLLDEAYSEAITMALAALEDDDLLTARGSYLLARALRPDDEEAPNRLRQVETTLTIADRRGDWSDALTDLSDLRELAPGSPTVLRAYIAALVGAGREAIAERNFRRAADLCGEANRWFPDRQDARQCLIQAGFPPTVPPAPTARPAPTSRPATAPAVQVVPPTSQPTTAPASATAEAVPIAPGTAVPLLPTVPNAPAVAPGAPPANSPGPALP